MEFCELTLAIIGCAYRVYNRMGFGYLESVYEKCLVIELEKAGLHFDLHQGLTVTYDGKVVGEFIPDIVVDGAVIVELGSVRRLALAHEMQLVNYLVSTGKPVVLLINFGEHRVDVGRKLRNLQRVKRGSC